MVSKINLIPNFRELTIQGIKMHKNMYKSHVNGSRQLNRIGVIRVHRGWERILQDKVREVGAYMPFFFKS